MENSDSEGKRVIRPRGLRWLTLALLAESLVCMVSAVRVLQYSADFAELQLSVPSVVLLGRDILWAILFLIGTVRLWQMRNGAHRLVLLLVGVFSLFQFVWWGMYVRSDYGRTRFPFAVILVICAIGLLAWYLNLPHVRVLFDGRVSDSGPTNTLRQKS